MSLAQASIGSTVLTVIIVLGAGLLLVVLAAYARKSLLKKDDLADATPGGFSLSDLRRLRDSGEMRADEYERARAMIVDAAKRAADRAATPVAETVVPKSPGGPTVGE